MKPLLRFSAALALVFSVCPVLCALSFELPSISLCADAGIIQDFAGRDSSRQLSVDLRADISNRFQIRLPVNFTFNRTQYMIDGALMLTAYPFDNLGFFAGMTLVQIGYQLKKNQLAERACALNEVVLGWTFPIKKHLLIEGSVSIRDPSGTFKDEYAALRGLFPCYKAYRFHLVVGWKFN